MRARSWWFYAALAMAVPPNRVVAPIAKAATPAPVAVLILSMVLSFHRFSIGSTADERAEQDAGKQAVRAGS